jgi:hypothetical protein
MRTSRWRLRPLPTVEERVTDVSGHDAPLGQPCLRTAVDLREALVPLPPDGPCFLVSHRASAATGARRGTRRSLDGVTNGARKYPSVANPGDRAAYTGISTSGCHGSNCASSLGGSGSDTRVGRREQRAQLGHPVPQHRIERSQPARSAITVGGMSGNSLSSSRIRGSTSSTIEPLRSRA